MNGCHGVKNRNCSLLIIGIFSGSVLGFFVLMACTPAGAELLNYGGVYVGLPADLNTVAASQSKSTRKGEEHTQRKTVIKIK
uniref:Uncharacterized protein n=1 Tax=Sinocyclocheilus grahami TaxID=75366 RepID=A0A672RV85_SINGR